MREQIPQVRMREQKDHDEEVKQPGLYNMKKGETEKVWGSIIYLCPSGNRRHLLPTL